MTSAPQRAIEHARREVEAADAALDAFDDPVVTEHPGLELMQAVLVERRDKLAAVVERLETPSLHVVFEAASGGADVDAALLAGVVGSLQEAVRAEAERLAAGADPPWDTADLAAAGRLRVQPGEGDVAVRLSGRRDPAAAGGAASLVQRAVDAVVAALGGDAVPPPGEHRDALVRLAAAVRGAPVVVRLTWQPVAAPEVDVVLDRAAAERLLADVLAR